MTPEWRVPLVPDRRISIILATFDPDLLAIEDPPRATTLFLTARRR
jgi:hypothetical protein